MDVPVPYLQVPATITNQALDVLGESGQILGSLTDGTNVAETARRNYGQALRQLLRTAHWAWARKREKLTLLGDATGQSAAPVIQTVECPWTYAYAWPTDAVQGRWMPWNPTNAQPTSSTGVPLTTGVSIGVPYPMVPGRFLVTSSSDYPIEVGNQPWNQMPDLQRTEGLGPAYRKIILTDCACAEFVYTRLGTVIEEWDDLFRQAMVMMMAMVIAPVAITNEKLRFAAMDRLRPALKTAIDDARLASGNEAGFPQGVDHLPNWITARGGGAWGAAGGGLGFGGGGYSGYTFFPWDGSMSWAGSVF